MIELLGQLVAAGHPVRVHYIDGHWTDVAALAGAAHPRRPASA
ncbi:MAG: hypothetical protein ABUL68_02545 [Pseudomonadota bacterium]